MITVALSGASGFIGTHLSRRLHDRGDRVVALRRGVDGSVIPSTAMDRCDAVIHLAFPVNPEARQRDKEKVRREVETAAHFAAHLAQRFDAKRLLLASSGKIFGATADLPLRDDSPTRPDTFLGELKLLAETTTAQAISQSSVTALSLRIFNCYGPGQGHGFLVPKLIDGVKRGSLELGELHHRRDWIHVDDVVDAMLTALIMPAEPGRLVPVNVGTGRSVDVNELLSILREAGIPVPEPAVALELLRPAESQEERADTARLRKAGWTPKVQLETGLVDVFRLAFRRDTGSGV